MSSLIVPVSSTDHIQGPDHAELTLVEYGDFECPYCGEAYPIIKRVQKHFGERLRFVFRNFPLSRAHPHAELAAEAAEFAASTGKFWEMHDLLYENQRRLNDQTIAALAQRLKLSPSDLRFAIQDGEFRSRVREDFAGGVRSGVNGTPTFFINGRRHDGQYDFDTLIEAMELVKS